MPGSDALVRRVTSDALGPYVIYAWHTCVGWCGSGKTWDSVIEQAVLRHLRLILGKDVATSYCGGPSDDLLDAARQRIADDRRSDDRLCRYLSKRRLELPEMIVSDSPSRQLAYGLAVRTWREIRRNDAISAAFDRHMIARSSEHVRIRPAPDAAHLLVDVGGGPGHYAQRLLTNLGRDWQAMILEDYSGAGWAFRSDDGQLPARVQVRCGGSWADLPRRAGVYLLASILHNLDDENALALLRRCSAAADAASRVVVVERTWDPALLRDSSRDLDMRLLFGGRERSDAELAALFSAAGLVGETTVSTSDGYRVLTCRTRGHAGV